MQVWLADLVASLQSSSDWQVDVALTSGAHHDDLAYQQAYPHLPITPLVNPTGSAEGRRRAINSYLHRHQPHLVIGVNIADLYPAVRRTRRQGFKGKVALSLHAIDGDLLADCAAQADLLDAVVATNQLSCCLVARQTGVPAARVLYAPCGVNISTLPLPSGAPPPLRIAWVGRLEQAQKRVDDLPAIVRNLEQAGVPFQLTIAGDGPEAASLSKALAPWIQSGKVVMAGALSSSQLASQVYANHHVLLITSSWETGPIVAWEAMAAGLVVVSSSYVGFGREGALVEGRTALLFPVGDAFAAAVALERATNPALAASLRIAGHELVARRYSAQASRQSWVTAFEQVLAFPDLPMPAPEAALPPSGRLEHLLGVGPAESLRRRLGVRFQHTSPGGEWPHTAHGGTDEQSLLSLAAQLDTHA
ncbi:MAG: glycosyltransferase family 4 protein [Synechococcaceae cyanobacterium ELA739]